MNRRQALLSAAALLSGRGLAPLPASAQSPAAAEARAIAKEAYHLRLPARRQLSHPVFVFRRSRRPGVQGALEHDLQQRAGLHARRQGDPDAQFGHALFLCRRRPARRAAGVHGAGGREGPLLLAAVHRHVHVQLRLCRQPRDRQRRRQLSAGRAGLEGREAQRDQGGDPLRNRIRLRPLPHAAVRSRRHRKREEDPGRLQGAAAVGLSRRAAARRSRPPSTSSSRSRPRRSARRWNSSTS